MSIRRHNAMRDKNDGELRAAAERLGWYMVKIDTPADYLGCLKSIGRWYPVELKTEDGDFTTTQKFFRQDCLIWRMPYLVWRTVDDVVAQTNAMRSSANAIEVGG